MVARARRIFERRSYVGVFEKREVAKDFGAVCTGREQVAGESHLEFFGRLGGFCGIGRDGFYRVADDSRRGRSLPRPANDPVLKCDRPDHFRV